MKARTIIADYFSFNRAEQRGICILLLVLAALLVMKRVMPGSDAEPPAGAAAFEREVAAFQLEIARAEEERRNQKQKPRDRKSANAYAGFARDTTFRERSPRPPAFTVDLNEADTLDLQRLRGIGPGFARRIAGYRNKLGGYVDKSQLLEVYGMDKERYAMIRDHVVVKGGQVRKIDLNTVTFKGLIAHPYFPYELTKEIIIYRKKVKRFNSPAELKNVPGVSDSVFMKVSPYVVVQ